MMKKISFFIILRLLLLSLISSHLFATTRGIRVTAKTGESLYLYKDYHALVVGVSNYEKWPRLPNPVNDAREVASKLKELGFEVKLVLDPTSREMKTVLSEMVYDMGIEENRALLFYYAGHGETEVLADKTKMGYIIPRDCPILVRNPKGFATHAISMRDIESASMRIKSKHVLMLFDSCFSGSLFALVRAVPDDITEKSALPVRQYITAGREDEQVPDKSMFKRCFLLGLEGDADLTGDGYVTGSELGMYLSDKVVNYTHRRQHPQYGKINNPDLDRGDFIFKLPAISVTPTEKIPGPEIKATLSVEANVSGARVFVDGKMVGKTPLLNEALSEGEVRIKVEKEGYEPYIKPIYLERGRSLSLYVDMDKAKPHMGRLFIEIEPKSASVRILNIRQQFHPGMNLKPGRYHLEVSAKGHVTKSRWIELGAGEDKNINFRLEKLQVAKTTTPTDEKIPSNIPAEVSTKIEKLKSSDPVERANAALRLRRMGISAAGAVPYLVAILGDNTKLSITGIPLSSTSPGKEAAFALSKIGERGIITLIEALRDENNWARRHAALALGETTDARAIEALITALEDDKDWHVRDNAAKALGKLKDPRVVELLITALENDDNFIVRSHAAEALGNLKDPRAVEPLIYALEDGLILEDVAKALGKLKDPRAVEPLIDALKKTKMSHVHSAITKSLWKITGKPFGKDQKAWQKWWKQNKENFHKSK